MIWHFHIYTRECTVWKILRIEIFNPYIAEKKHLNIYAERSFAFGLFNLTILLLQHELEQNYNQGMAS